MRALKIWLWLPVALGGCTASTDVARPAAQSGPTFAQSAPGNVRMQNTVGMADQYNRPHPGPAGTGASTWVAAAPPPAYVDTSAPPPRAPDPAPLAAVANRQPSAPAARPAAIRPDAERPEVAMANGGAAAGPAARPQATALTAAEVTKGRSLFADNGCGGCHRLADAGGSGGIGPSFDGNAGLTREIAFATIHDGRGPMPSFAGQIPDADIRTLAAYIVQAKK